MLNIDMNTWVRSILNDSAKQGLPIMTHPGIELIGKKVIDAVTDGNAHYSAIKALNDAYHGPAACMIMDLSVEAECFGAEVSFSEDDVPNVIGRLVAISEEINRLEVPDIDNGRVPQCLKAVKLASENLDVPVLAGCIGPFSLAGRLYDITEMMMGIYIDPESMKVLLAKSAEFICKYCIALKNAGANGVIMAEPAAGLLSNDDCYNYSSVYVKRIVEKVQDEHFIVILHNCGNSGQCTDAMVRTGCKGYHFGNGIDMLKALVDCPSDVLVMGNLDPVSIFKMASAEQVYEKTMELMKKCGSYPNFIPSSGCDVPPGTPQENITAFYKAIEDYNS